MQTSNFTYNFKWQHFAVVFVGLLVFVLLFIADKTNLNNNSDPELSASDSLGGGMPPMTNGADDGADLLAKIPAIPADSLADPVLARLADSASGPGRVAMLKQLAGRYRDLGRFDAAAVYAGLVAQDSATARYLLVAGALCREALKMPGVADDQEVFRSFSDRGIALLERALKLEPENEAVLIELGLSIVESRREGGAAMQGIQHLVKAVTINPDNEEAHFNLGVFSLRTGQMDKAANRFENVIRINPRNLEAGYFLATVYIDLGRPDDAVPLLQKLAAQDDDVLLAKAAADLLTGLKK